MDLTLAIIGVILVLIGFAGSILPVIPGPPISWAGFLLLRWTDYVHRGHEGYENALWILLFFVILVTVLDYAVPIIGTKKYGGSKRGVWGATLGVVVGLFFGLAFFFGERVAAMFRDVEIGLTVVVLLLIAAVAGLFFWRRRRRRGRVHAPMETDREHKTDAVAEGHDSEGVVRGEPSQQARTAATVPRSSSS